MKIQLILLSLAAAILVVHGAGVTKERKVPAIWRRLMQLPTRQDRAEMVMDAMNEKSLLDDQVIALINKLISNPAADPLNIAHLDLNINTDLAQLQGSLDAISTTGISGLVVTNLKISPLLFKAEFAFELPALTLAGNYDIDGVLASLLPVYGTGPFTVWLENLKASGTINLATNLSIKTLTIDLGLSGFKVDFQNLLGDPELSDVVNDMINDLGLGFLSRFETSIETFVAELIKNKYNALITGKSVGEIVEFVTDGKSGINTKAECKP